MDHFYIAKSAMGRNLPMTATGQKRTLIKFMVESMKFLKRNCAFILPALWLFVAVMHLWRALNTQDNIEYLQAFAFSTLVYLSSVFAISIRARQQKNDK